MGSVSILGGIGATMQGHEHDELGIEVNKLGNNLAIALRLTLFAT